MTTQRTLSFPFILAGSICAALYLYMSTVSRAYSDATLIDAVLVYGGAGLATVLMVLWLRPLLIRQPLTALELRSVIAWIVGFGCLFRLISVFAHPVMEDDFYRYLWDGWVFAGTGTPYGVAPEEFFASEELSDKFEAILDSINYPGVATVYGPTLQLLFGFSHLLAPGSVWPLQWAAGLADIAVMLVLLKLLGGFQPSAPDRLRNAQLLCFVLYAWSPLLIKEFTTTAHPDVLGALFVVIALLLRQRSQWVGVGFVLALAAGVKPFALIFAPFLIGFNVRAIGSFGVTVLLLSLPFILGAGPNATLVQSFLAVWLPEGLRAMGGGWLFNAGLYELAAYMGLVEQTLMRQLALGGFALIWAVKLWHSLSRQASMEQLASTLVWLFGVFLLLLPTLNPWYLAWWLPFAVISPAITPWVASLAVLLSYVIPLNLAVPGGVGDLYRVPGWVLLIEFSTIALALALDTLRIRKEIQKERARQ